MINRAELKSMAKEQIRGNIGPLFLCFLVYSLITGASSFTYVGPIVVAPPLILGLVMLFLDLTKGEKPTLEKMFKGFQIFGKSILLSLAISIFTCLWSLLLIVPGVIKSISYSFAWFILAENPQMSAMDAIRASKEMTNGHKMDLFVLYLSFIPWMLLGTITFGLAYIYVAPYMSATYTNAYLQVKGGAAPVL